MGEKDNLIDNELVRNDELIAGSESLKVKAQEMAILEKIYNGENLAEEELLSMHLSPETIKEYIETMKVLDVENSITDEERASNIIKRENDKIEAFNQSIERLKQEKIAVKKLDIFLLEIVDTVKSLHAQGITINEINDFLNQLSSENKSNPLYDYLELNDTKLVEKNKIAKFFGSFDVGGGQTLPKKVHKSLEEYLNFPKEIKIKVLQSDIAPEDIIKGVEEMKPIFKEGYAEFLEQIKTEKMADKEIEDKLTRNLDEEEIEEIRKKLSE
jgi:hypothetical protein